MEAVLAVAVVVSAFLVFDHAAQRLQSKASEWQYIYSSRYFANLFSDGGPANPEWADGYWTHDQPMVAHYVLGAWLSALGRDVYRMPDPWSSYTTGLGNSVVGPVPDSELLGEARALMVLLAALVALLVYLVGRVLGGSLAGVGAAVLLLSRPLFGEELVLVQTESLYTLLVLVALLLALLGAAARRGRQFAGQVGHSPRRCAGLRIWNKAHYWIQLRGCGYLDGGNCRNRRFARPCPPCR